MKFRAKIQGVYLSNLRGRASRALFPRPADLFSAADKIHDLSVLLLSPEKTRVVCVGSGDSPSLFCEIENVVVPSLPKQNVLFYEFKIESLTENRIFLRVANRNMLKGLSDVQSAVSGVLKLSKPNNIPVLQISLEMRNTLSIVHDVPVEVVDPSEQPQMNEPEIQSPEIKIEFPHYDVVRRVTSSLRPIHKTLILAATRGGELSLRSEAEAVQVRTVFSDLRVLDTAESEGAAHGVRSYQVHVLASQFLKLANYCVLKPLDAVCCLSPDALALFCVVIRGGLFVTYYLPILRFDRVT